MLKKWQQIKIKLNSDWHEKALWIFLLLVLGHFSEHLVQLYQIYILGWLPEESVGLLGLWFPVLVTSEYLHIFYNGLTWIGIFLLVDGLSKNAKLCWHITFAFATWHLIEHILLQYQFTTGNFWFGRSIQTGIGQIWFPRPELHFVYNILVFAPMMIAYFLNFYRPPRLRF